MFKASWAQVEHVMQHFFAAADLAADAHVLQLDVWAKQHSELEQHQNANMHFDMQIVQVVLLLFPRCSSCL
jgi:hypothetical protein